METAYKGLQNMHGACLGIRNTILDIQTVNFKMS